MPTTKKAVSKATPNGVMKSLASNKMAYAGLIVSVIVAFLAFRCSRTSFEDVGEQIALKLLDLLPRKHQNQAEFRGYKESNNNNSHSHQEQTVPSTPPAAVYGKESILDGPAPYNPKEAMEARYLHIRDTCGKYSDFMRPEYVSATVEANIDDYYYLPNEDVTVCRVPHTAAKSVELAFQRLFSGGKDAMSKKDAFKRLFPKSMKGMKKMLVVRHPLERLISVYRHKYEAIYDVTEDKEVGGEVSFQEFVDILLEGPTEYNNFLEEHGMEDERSSIEVDTGMIDGLGVSKAWAPIWKMCGVCNLDTQPLFIVNMDHIQDDLAVLNSEVIGDKDAISSLVKADWPKKSHLPEVAQHYYSQITKEEIRDLAEKYRLDHELFGYKPDYYIQFGKDEPKPEKDNDLIEEVEVSE